MVEIRVSVRNETDIGGLYLTPVWVGFNDGGFDLFDIGDTASAGLERLAEDGTLDTLNGEFAAATGVTGLSGMVSGDFGAAGVIDPFELASTIFDVDEQDHRYLQFGAMVIPSNDAFIGSDDPIELFDAGGNFNGATQITIHGSDVLDAGTEANTEQDAAFINQNAPNTGDATNSAIAAHPGYIGGENGPVAGPNGEPMTILGGTTAAGTIIDPTAGDFSRDGFELATVHINVVARHEGGADADEILGGSADDIVDARGGNDVIETGDGWDVISAGRGMDLVYAGRGDDIIDGGAGRDFLFGERGDDVILGGFGRDFIEAGPGNDFVFGGGGGDWIDGEASDDFLFGGGGADVMLGGTGRDVLIGGGGNDLMSGGNSQDIIFGGAGHDVINGDDGNDQINGGAGNDLIIGGAGRNTITTGSGEDVVVLTGEGAHDRVTDFDLVLDLIAISAAGVTEFADLTITGTSSSRIAYNGSDAELIGVAAADLTADHFLFV
ncbi:hypothetical protein GE300_09385 [Rhodobacteraceae bacterium 2CG4]|uniref:Spondin domain-containing protein n=1 Tax=Halovulum marinum TaxID=2662447 RepID=A0A6L5YZT4_9RHOB|nr:spondin domain-containing protein [Halovulum marinum]MSU89826.1 hypothetical protein [Halovulum marinum]